MVTPACTLENHKLHILTRHHGKMIILYIILYQVIRGKRKDIQVLDQWPVWCVIDLTLVFK